jgi:hypothetical protein
MQQQSTTSVAVAPLAAAIRFYAAVWIGGCGRISIDAIHMPKVADRRLHPVYIPWRLNHFHPTGVTQDLIISK